MGLGDGVKKPEMLQTLENRRTAGPLKDTGDLEKETGLRDKGGSIWGCLDSLWLPQNQIHVLVGIAGRVVERVYIIVGCCLLAN